MVNIYSGVKNGFAQEHYPDQQATALAGSLAFASDLSLIDAFSVGNVGENGLEAGLAVVLTPVSGVFGSQRAGINCVAVALPSDTAIAAEIVGVTIRGQQMRTNAAGRACYFAEDMCNVARAGRSGARVWVRLAEDAQPVLNGDAFVRIDAANAGKFTHEAASNAIALSGAKFRSAAESGLALVELM